MKYTLPNLFNSVLSYTATLFGKNNDQLNKLSQAKSERILSVFTIVLAVIFLCLVATASGISTQKLLNPILSSFTTDLQPLQDDKKSHEVFGFAPYWTFNKLDNVDYDTLTTFAYFGIDVLADGSLDTEGPGYNVFMSDKATAVFQKAHSHGTRVVLTVTQMENETLEEFLGNQAAQDQAVASIVSLVKQRGIDGVNVDFEYDGNPGKKYSQAYTNFLADLRRELSKEIPHSHLTISVYASAAKATRLYDIAAIAPHVDGIFMMAYDFYSRASGMAMPTAPLYGAEKGKYSYDIATAVDDFLKKIPADKLILGVPYYGYSYLMYSPEPFTETRPSWTWRGKPSAQTIEYFTANVTAEKSGWDKDGQVAWQAHYEADTDTWRMIFLENEKSLGIKYDYAKSKGLKGVGMWALGFDNGTTKYWALLREKFGTKLADSRVYQSE